MPAPVTAPVSQASAPVVDYSLLPAWNYMVATPSPEPSVTEANITNDTEGQVISSPVPAINVTALDQRPSRPVATQKKNDLYNMFFWAILFVDMGCALGAIALWYVAEKK
jgi:hypothetical protein